MTADSTLMPAEARSLLDGMRRATALVVGDVMLDRYVIGAVERVSPEAPVPVVSVHAQRRAPGGAANVASGIRSLGARCRLVGARGNDRAGQTVGALLERRGIEASLIVDESRPTTVKTRVLAHEQQVVRIDHEQAAPLPEEQRRAILEAALAWLEDASVLVLQDYDKGTLSSETARELLAAAAAHDVPSIVDPKLRHFFDFPGASVLKPNLRELAAALGVERPRLDDEGLRSVAERAECAHLVVTLGADGMLLYSHETGEADRVPAHRREVYDVSGAGDTVTAVLAAGLGSGAPLRRVAVLANFAAGLAVSRQGARPVSARQIRDALPDDDSEAV